MVFLNKNLSLREKVAQTSVVLTSANRFLSDPVGGIFIGAQVITDATDGVSLVRDTVNKYKGNMSIPPLVISDFENGCGSMIKGLTAFPFGMSLGAANDEKLAYDYGKATAIEALSAGANATFSPVCDLNLNPRNPLVNVRAISDDPNLAIPILKQIILGMQENGLAACAKHFPGDGVDSRDQHIITTANTLDMENWRRYSGKVFEELIKIKVAMIMAGHISLPHYQTKNSDGFYLPATLSPELLQNLLKGEMGYKGVVVSDATMMGGFNGYYKTKTESEIECFKAGCDLVLWPTDQYIDSLTDAIQNGYVGYDRLNDALNRIEEMKNKYIKNTDTFPEITPEQKAFALDTQRKTAEKSITLVRDKHNLFPLKKKSKILILSLCNYPPTLPDAEGFKTELKNLGYTVDYYTSRPSDEIWNKKAAEADLILYALYTRSFRPIGPIDFWEDKAWAVAHSFKDDLSKTAYISFGNPYFAEQYCQRFGSYINAYSMLPSSIKAAAKAIAGEIPFTDFSPVNLKINFDSDLNI